MRQRPRLAILECDECLPNAKKQYGGYGGMYKSLLNKGARAEGYGDVASILDISIHQIEKAQPDPYPDLESVDALLLTGSRHDSFSDAPWILTLLKYTAEALKTNRVRIIGICFGHQILARAMGVKVGRNADGWEAAVHDVQLTKRGQELFRLKDLRIAQSHRDIVYSYPPDAEPLGSSPICSVQGMYSAGRYITVQGHPEYTPDIIREIIETRHKLAVFDDEEYKTHSKKIDLPHDGIAISQSFIRFLLEV